MTGDLTEDELKVAAEGVRSIRKGRWHYPEHRVSSEDNVRGLRKLEKKLSELAKKQENDQ